MQIKKCEKSSAEFTQCLEIRKQVFVDEQHVPLALEIDGLDAQAQHYLLLIKQQAYATARVRRQHGYAKVERVAVIKSGRGRGFGVELLRFIIADIKQQHDVTGIKLSSQTHALGFYQKLGFIAKGESYNDAGMPHQDMWLTLTNFQQSV